MPSLKDATKKPSNVADDPIEITSAQSSSLPLIPNRETAGLTPGSLGPAPSVFTTEYDRVRQWCRPGTSQNRFPPLPTKSNPQINASSSGVAANKVAPVQRQTTANTGNIATNTQNIAALQATSFQGAYDPTVSYSQGASVDSGGIIYISLVNNNLGNTPASSPSDWQSVAGTASYAGVWNSGTAYTIGQTVSIGSVLY